MTPVIGILADTRFRLANLSIEAEGAQRLSVIGTQSYIPLFTGFELGCRILWVRGPSFTKAVGRDRVCICLIGPICI
jgi:hypothetical protein